MKEGLIIGIGLILILVVSAWLLISSFKDVNEIRRFRYSCKKSCMPFIGKVIEDECYCAEGTSWKLLEEKK